MARPSNKEKRAEEILTAFEWCVAKYGVEGSTLEKIANKANLARALIRHHIGNRESLITLLVDRVIDKSNLSIDALVSSLDEHNRTESLISFLFNQDYSDQQLILVFSALITAAGDRPEIAVKLNKWVKGFIKTIADQIFLDFNQQPRSKIDAIATGITGIYFNVDSLRTLGDINLIRIQSKESVHLLIQSLKN